MKKCFAIVFIILLLFSSVVPISIGYKVKIKNFMSQISNPRNTLYVGGSGFNNYTRIQDAIDNASDGDTVFVFNGTYYENIIISKSITLEGENILTTIIDGGFLGYVIYISAQYVNLSKFTVINSGKSKDYCGIKLEIDYNYCNINNNIIKKNHKGIVICSDFNTIINNNIIYNQEIGIDLSRCSTNIIQGNTILKVNLGIDALNVNSCNIKNNNISLNNASIKFVESIRNTVSENIIGYNEMGAIILYSSFNIIKKNNFIGNNKYHAYFETCFNLWIHNYWDNYFGFGFKPIRGLMYYYEWLGPWEDPIEISIPWIQFDLHPVKEPYYL